MSLPLFPDLPPYTLRVSPRARYLRIRVCPREGVVVTLPRWVSRAQALAFLHERRDWVERALVEVDAQRRALAEARARLPETIALTALGRTHPVEYRHSAGAARVRRAGDTLVVSGRREDGPALRAALRRWLLREGQAALPPWLQRVSADTGLDFSKLTVRAQRTLWGSCTHRRDISLNCKLLMLSDTLVRYVMVHELAHTRHLNHSARFWQLVARFEPHHAQHERALREAARQMPAWVDG